jgi:hypothetical protein
VLFDSQINRYPHFPRKTTHLFGVLWLNQIQIKINKKQWGLVWAHGLLTGAAVKPLALNDLRMYWPLSLVS